jgi:hypothetical protein
MVDDYHLTGSTPPAVDDPKRIGLADMLRALRIELLEAQENVSSSGEAPILDLEGAEVEVKFTVVKGAKGKVGAELHFFAVELGGKYEVEEVHQLRLKLQPATNPDGTKRHVSVAE